MATFRFGSSISSCRTVREEAPEVVLYDTKEDPDPNKLIQCPFDKNHQIRSSRFPYHLIKCRKNHPKVANELRTCPYNARHLVHVHELAAHTATCDFKMSVDLPDDGSTDRQSKFQVPVSTWVNPNQTEDWEKEADEFTVPFVWGENSVPAQTKVENYPTNLLPRTIRSPEAFPWAS